MPQNVATHTQGKKDVTGLDAQDELARRLSMLSGPNEDSGLAATARPSRTRGQPSSSSSRSSPSSSSLLSPLRGDHQRPVGEQRSRSRQSSRRHAPSNEQPRPAVTSPREASRRNLSLPPMPARTAEQVEADHPVSPVHETAPSKTRQELEPVVEEEQPAQSANHRASSLATAVRINVLPENEDAVSRVSATSYESCSESSTATLRPVRYSGRSSYPATDDTISCVSNISGFSVESDTISQNLPPTPSSGMGLPSGYALFPGRRSSRSSTATSGLLHDTASLHSRSSALSDDVPTLWQNRTPRRKMTVSEFAEKLTEALNQVVLSRQAEADALQTLETCSEGTDSVQDSLGSTSPVSESAFALSSEAAGADDGDGDEGDDEASLPGGRLQAWGCVDRYTRTRSGSVFTGGSSSGDPRPAAVQSLRSSSTSLNSGVDSGIGSCGRERSGLSIDLLLQGLEHEPEAQRNMEYALRRAKELPGFAQLPNEQMIELTRNQYACIKQEYQILRGVQSSAASASPSHCTSRSDLSDSVTDFARQPTRHHRSSSSAHRSSTTAPSRGHHSSSGSSSTAHHTGAVASATPMPNIARHHTQASSARRQSAMGASSRPTAQSADLVSTSSEESNSGMTGAYVIHFKIGIKQHSHISVIDVPTGSKLRDLIYKLNRTGHKDYCGEGCIYQFKNSRNDMVCIRSADEVLPVVDGKICGRIFHQLESASMQG